MNKKFRSLISIILALVTIFTLTACGSKTDTPNDDNSSNTKSSKREVTDEDYIVRVTGSFPLYTDPGVGSSAIEAAAQINLYDALVFADIDGSIKPHLAESWTMSDDGMKYTFKIKEGVKFHSGNDLTAEDVAFSISLYAICKRRYRSR